MDLHPIVYDKNGRMEYNPYFHSKQGMPWENEDVQYIIDWYNIVGPEEISFALDRTIKSVMQKAGQLRKEGRMKGIVTRNTREIKKELPKQPKLKIAI